MKFNTTDYFAYKKNKIQMETEKPKKPLSKLNFLFQLFIATFIIIFIIIVVSIMKYSSKMDIEYSKGDLSLHDADSNGNIASYGVSADDEQRKIDKRLVLIQQEDNAPSEAKIINADKNNAQVIDPIHIEKNKKLEKLEKLEKTQKQNEEALEKDRNKLTSALEEIKQHNKKQTEDLQAEKNVIIMSKVLIGRYATFEEAQKTQNSIKAQDSLLSPFVKKVGDVFCVQMGSYQDFNVAKAQAQKLKTLGFDVWIYQQ